MRKCRTFASLQAFCRAKLRGVRTKGLLHDYVGSDREQGFLTNVSVWETLADAHQMDTLAAMLAQRPILEEAGVTFEPISNHETSGRSPATPASLRRWHRAESRGNASEIRSPGTGAAPTTDSGAVTAPGRGSFCG